MVYWLSLGEKEVKSDIQIMIGITGKKIMFSEKGNQNSGFRGVEDEFSRDMLNVKGM